jgi:hypothetical protein
VDPDDKKLSAKERKSRSRELRQELVWSFGISTLRVSGNRGGSALGLRVLKTEESDMSQEFTSKVESV